MPPKAARGTTYLVTGASGFIGSYLAQTLMDGGDTVRTLTRAGWSGPPAVPLTHRYYGSLPGAVPPAAFEGVDVVVHCAAASQGTDRFLHMINCEGTLNLARAAVAAGTRAFIFLSSQSAHSTAVSGYGRSKYAAERELLGLQGLKVVTLRPGLVWGPGRRGLFHQMGGTVGRLPFIPLLDGGRSLVQPVHVADLCRVILTCAGKSSELAGAVLPVGDPEGLTLASFLQLIALAQRGQRKLVVTVPWALVYAPVRAAEALGIPLPIHTNNLAGLRSVARMETAPSLARLNLGLRPVSIAPEDLREQSRGGRDGAGLDRRPAEVLLVGGGRAGLVHALTLSRLPGVALWGVADRKRSVLKFLRGMGLSFRPHSSLEDALGQGAPDAVVIATPTPTHLELTRACVSRGLPVLVEKPLANCPEALEQFRALSDEYPQARVMLGYLLPRMPHMASFLERLANGEFGRVKGFAGLTLHSHARTAARTGWELDASASGGGVLINSGSHVLSVILRAFGPPRAVQARSLSITSPGVEDSVVARLVYPSFSGAHYASWAMDGFPRQENRLVILTDRGQLMLTSNLGFFIDSKGQTELVHQLDTDVGFNLAPDYVGAGFSAELEELRRLAETGHHPLMDLQEALKVDELVFRVYATCREASGRLDLNHTGLPTAVAPAGLVSGSGNPAHTFRRVLDLRELEPPAVRDYLQAGPDSCPAWAEYALVPTQVSELNREWLTSSRLRVTVPDFLKEARLLSSGRYVQFLRELTWRELHGLLAGALARVVRDRAPTFWVASVGLLGASLAQVPTTFRGTLLVHSYLTDLAVTLDRTDVLELMVRLCRRRCPKACVGLHTNLARETLNVGRLLECPLDMVSFLSSPGACGLPGTISQARERSGPPLLTAEVGPAPAALHLLATRHAEQWTHGADFILVGASADERLAQVVREQRSRAWEEAFPGTELPTWAL